MTARKLNEPPLDSVIHLLAQAAEIARKNRLRVGVRVPIAYAVWAALDEEERQRKGRK